MTDKISEELLQLMDDARQQEPDRPLNIIITMVEGVNPNELAEQGFELRQVYDTIPAASATMTAEQINALASSNQVKRIEYDGEMYALGGES